MDVSEAPLGRSAGKAVHISTVHPSGDPRILHRECASLAAANYEVVLLAKDTPKVPEPGVRVAELPRIRCHLLRRLILPWIAIWAALRHKPDVIHTHDPELLPAALLVRRLKRVVLVHDVHEHFSEDLRGRGGKLGAVWSWTARRTLEGPALRGADGLVTATDGLALALESTSGAKVVRVENLPRLRDVAGVAHPVPDGPHSWDLVHVGSLSPGRARFLMQVFDELRKDRPLATMIFVGVKPAYYPWLLQVQEDFQADGVTLKGSMSYAEVLRHLDGSKVGINYHPLGRRFHTAIPNKVLEYMARGLLTVSTDLPELRKLLGEVPGVTLASSTSPRLYAQAARNFLELPQEEVARIKLAMLGRVKEGLTWEVRAEPQLLDLYRRLMEEACAS